MSLLIKNIKSLLQVRDSGVDKVSGGDMAVLPAIEDSWILTEGNTIEDFGSMAELEHARIEMNGIEVIDASGKYLLPAFCD